VLIEGFGADISKLHKRIMEERDEFRSRVLSQRAASLPITDPRRVVFYANTKDPFSKSLHSGLPVPSHFTSDSRRRKLVQYDNRRGKKGGGGEEFRKRPLRTASSS
jgi:hypothetical protein